MKYKRFEDLPVWRDAIELAEATYSMTAKISGHGSLRDQIERAAVSISNNIAEGFERGTSSDLLKFIYYSRGSAGEVRSMLHLFERLQATSKLEEIPAIRERAISVSRQLYRWAETLQSSGLEGQRYETKQKQAFRIANREREEFLKELRANVAAGRK